MSERIYHGACGQWWTGANTGHCSGCHQTFAGSSFDRHQTISHGKVTCHNPATRGLVARTKPYGTLWGYPPPAVPRSWPERALATSGGEA